MAKTTFKEFPVDSASILFLSLIRPDPTNNIRFTTTRHETVDPDALQQAVNRIHKRFPSIIAYLRQDFFHYTQVPTAIPPQVKQEPGFLLPMTTKEIAEGCFRVYYLDNTITFEAFHAMTDGYGGITIMTTLVAEYLNIRYGLVTPACLTRLDVSKQPLEEEVEDSFLKHTDSKPKHLPSRYSYLPQRPEDTDRKVRVDSLLVDSGKIKAAAKRYGVTINSLITAVLSETVMELQLKKANGKKLKPVRVMIPVDLRRMVGSKTLRNFSLYTISTMEPEHKDLPLTELCSLLGNQLKQQLSKEAQLAMVSYNVRTQNAWYFKMIPWKIKAACMRIGYRFFGESNSSLTLTNLGISQFPEEMDPYIADFQCFLTPRVSSPYGCTVMTFHDKVRLNMSHFCEYDELGQLFFQKLKDIVEA